MSKSARFVMPEIVDPDERRKHRFFFRGDVGYFDGNTLSLCLQLMTLQAKVGETVDTEVEGMPRKTYYVIEDKNRRECGYRWISSTKPEPGISNPNDLSRKTKIIMLKKPTVEKVLNNPVEKEPEFVKIIPEGAIKAMSEVVEARNQTKSLPTVIQGVKFVTNAEPVASDAAVLLSSLRSTLHTADCLTDLLDRQCTREKGFKDSAMSEGDEHRLSEAAHHIGVALKHVAAIQVRMRESGL